MDKENPIHNCIKAIEMKGKGFDFTQRKAMTDEIMISELEMQSILEKQKGLTFKYKKINGVFIHTFCKGNLIYEVGLSPEKVVGKQLIDFLPWSIAQQKSIFYERAWQGKETVYEGNVGSTYYYAVLNPVMVDGNVVEVIVTCTNLTERRIREENILLTKEQLDSFFEQSFDAIVFYNLDGIILRVNATFESITNWKGTELVGKHVGSYLLEEELIKENGLLVQRVREGETISNYQTYLICKNGRKMMVSLTLAPLQDGKGNLVAISSIVRDITEIHEARNKLEESEMRYKSLFEYNPNVIFSIDLQGQITTCNPAIQQVLGYSPIEMVGEHFSPYIHPAFLNHTVDMFNHAVKGNPVTYESGIIHKNGELVEVLANNVPVVINGEIVGIHGTLTDITKQKNYQRQVINLSQQMQQLFHSVGDGIYGVDQKLTPLFWNKTAEQMTGFSLDEIVNRQGENTFFNKIIMKNLNFKEADSVISDCVRERIIRNVEQEICWRKDGSSFPIEYMITPLFEDNQVTGAVVIFRDITQRKKTEKLLRRSDKLNIVGQLAASMAHEIRNPLTALKGFLQILSERNDHQVYYDIMKEELDRLENITHEFITLSKPQAQRFEKKEVVPILHSMKTLLEREAANQNIRIDLDHEESIAPIYCDEQQIKLVFINVVKNAMDSMKDGGVVNLQCRSVNNQVIIRVIDNGCGIEPERMNHLGEPFYSTKEKGTGLGLMVCYKIVHEHQGEISIKSELYKGTMLDIILPASV